MNIGEVNMAKRKAKEFNRPRPVVKKKVPVVIRKGQGQGQQ